MVGSEGRDSSSVARRAKKEAAAAYGGRAERRGEAPRGAAPEAARGVPGIIDPFPP